MVADSVIYFAKLSTFGQKVGSKLVNCSYSNIFDSLNSENYLGLQIHFLRQAPPCHL